MQSGRGLSGQVRREGTRNPKIWKFLKIFPPVQDCEILRLDDNYRGELFPRELDNSALTVYMNVSILAFPKVRGRELLVFKLQT